MVPGETRHGLRLEDDSANVGNPDPRKGPEIAHLRPCAPRRVFEILMATSTRTPGYT